MFVFEGSLDKCLDFFILVDPVERSGGQETEIQDQPQWQGFCWSKADSQKPVNKSEHKREGEGDETRGDGDIVLKTIH